MADADEYEADPVVAEVDVYLSKQLASNLLLFQYPLRPVHMTYDDITHLDARVKPQQHKVELDLAINTHSPNYADSKGEQIALNVDGGTTGALYESDKMDKQTLCSTTAGVPTGKYVVGMLKDNELHLTPLQGVVQMKPGFSYLDKADARIKATAPDGEGGEESQDEEEEAKPVMVKFARHESAEAKARRMASYEYLRRKQEEESWIRVSYYQKDTDLSEKERHLMYAQHSNEVTEFHLQEEDYLKKLIPENESEVTKRPALPTNVLSMTDLKTMSLGDQIKALLISAKVIRFSQLLSLLPKGSDQAHVLRFVQQVALLVQGCWVVKSEVLYPKDRCSAFSGVPAETLCRGRDYIMWRYTQSRYLVRKDISSVIKLPAEDVKDMLEQMARLKVNRGWEFLSECDSEFMNRHPEVVQRQHMLWDVKFQQLTLQLNITKADLKAAAAQAASASASPTRRSRTVSRSRTKSGGMSSDFSDTDMDTGGTGRKRRSGDRRRRHSSSASSRSRKRSVSINELDPQIANNIHGKDVDMHSVVTSANLMESKNVSELMEVDEKGDHPQQNHNSANNGSNRSINDPNILKVEIVTFVTEKMRSHNILSMSEMRRMFNLRLAECPPGHILSTGVSDCMLAQAALDIGSIKNEPDCGERGETLYMLPKMGDVLDPLRSVIASMLTRKPMKITNVKKKLEEECGSVPQEADIKRILKEYCVTKGGCWHMKGLNQPGS